MKIEDTTMTMFRAGLAVAMVLIGGIAALLGAVVLISAMSSGSISLTYGSGASAVAETVSRASDPGRFMQLVGLLGAAPLIFGVIGAIWGMRTLRR